jgi:hypothetical protein
MPNRCPECNAPYEEETVCQSCGLLFAADSDVAAEAPRRRREDYAVQKRRATDVDEVPCRFCRGEIPRDAVRCRHCGQIVDDLHYASRMARIRANVNYASWVAWILGLLAFMIARPVGLIAIGAGMLLSIAYYAIPAERIPEKGERWGAKRLGRFLARQFRLERVTVPLPHFPGRRLVFVGTPILAAILGYFANFMILQRPMNEILKGNDAFKGMSVTTHFEYWVIPGVMVYDLRSVTGDQTPLDVYAAFLEYAREKQGQRYRRVELRFRGEPRFVVDGASFRRLGQEYQKRNYQWVLFEFPRLAKTLPLSEPAPKDGEALVHFHKHWYIDHAEKTSL